MSAPKCFELPSVRLIEGRILRLDRGAWIEQNGNRADRTLLTIHRIENGTIGRQLYGPPEVPLDTIPGDFDRWQFFGNPIDLNVLTNDLTGNLHITVYGGALNQYPDGPKIEWGRYPANDELRLITLGIFVPITTLPPPPVSAIDTRRDIAVLATKWEEANGTSDEYRLTWIRRIAMARDPEWNGIKTRLNRRS